MKYLIESRYISEALKILEEKINERLEDDEVILIPNGQFKVVAVMDEFSHLSHKGKSKNETT